MGKAFILVLLGTIVIYGITNLVINKNIYEMSDKSIEVFTDTKARNIGNSTAEILKVRLAADKNYRVTNFENISLSGGSAIYRVVDTIFAGESLIKLDIHSNFIESEKSFEAYVKIESELPGFFKKGVVGDKEVTFNGDQLSVKDTNNPTLNADIHSNQLVKLNGKNYLFEGFVTSSGDITIGGTNIVIVPNSNPSGSPVTQTYVPPVVIPNFVATTYLAKATTTYNGDKTFSGNLVLGTQANPAIIYVKGKAIMNATNVTGYGVIVAEQDIEVYANVTINSPHPTLSQFGLFTSGKLIINNSGTVVHATIFSQQEAILNSENITVIGSIASKDKVTFNGLKDKLFYKPPDESILNPFFELPYKRPKIAHYYE